MMQKPDPHKDAIDQLKKLVKAHGFTEILSSRKNKTHPMKENYKVMVSQLPNFDLNDPADHLIEYGIWNDMPKNWDVMN